MGAELNNADLSGAELNEANLSRAELNNADISDAELNNADLSGAELNEANLSWAKLNDADISDAELNNTDLSGAELNNADLWEAELINADLWEAELNNTDLSWAKLNNTDLSWAKLNKADISWTELNKADISWTELNKADLRGAELNKSNLEKVELNNADLRGAELNEVELNNANPGAELNDANLREAELNETELNKAELNGAKFSLFNRVKNAIKKNLGIIGITGIILITAYHLINRDHPPATFGKKYLSTYSLIQNTYKEIDDGVFENWVNIVKEEHKGNYLFVNKGGEILKNSDIRKFLRLGKISDNCNGESPKTFGKNLDYFSRKNLGESGNNISLNGEIKYPFSFNCNYNLEEKINLINEKNIKASFENIKIENGSLEDVIKKITHDNKEDFENLLGILAVEKNNLERNFNLEDLDLKNCGVNSKNYQNQIAQTFCAYDIFENNKSKILEILKQKEEIKNYLGNFESVVENFSILSYKIGIDTTKKIIKSEPFNYFVKQNFNADDLVMATTISNFGRGSNNFKIGLDDIKYLAEVEVVKGKI